MNTDDIFSQDILTFSNSSLNKPKFKHKTLLKLIFLIIYFIIIITIEPFVRDYLFEQSILFEERMEASFSSSTITFFKLYTHIGSSKILLPIIFIVFIISPLKVSFALLSSYIYASYATNTMKLIYHSPRPIWVSENIKYECDNGFGNPSGHSFSSSSFYLSLACIITNISFIKKQNHKIIITIFIYLFFIIIILLTMFSRLVLGAHSINQVIYGCLLGTGTHFLLFHVIDYLNFSNESFYKKFNETTNVLIFSIVHAMLILISLVIYLTFKPEDVSKFDRNLRAHGCKERPIFKKYQHDGFYQSLSALALIGAVLGMKMAFQLIKKDYPNKGEHIVEWNKNYSNWKKVLLRLLLTVVSCTFFLLNVVVPSDIPLALIFIFKTGAGFLLGVFGMFGFGVYLSVKCHVANENIEGEERIMQELEQDFL